MRTQEEITPFTLTAEAELHWLALILVPALGPRKARSLIEKFRTPEGVFAAATDQIEDCGISSSMAQTIASGCTFEDAADQQALMRKHGAVLISMRDGQYPDRLREIYDPPVVLFARGRVELLHTVMLGVVGTRRPTAYGIAATERLSADLAAAQLTIVSGMARGIDTAAHKAVLGVNGATVAIFGCGVDLVYPAENRKLATTIAEKGLVSPSTQCQHPPILKTSRFETGS